MRKKSEAGYTLLEAMTAVFVLVIGIGTMAPILKNALDERTAIRHHEEALTVINNELSLWAAGARDQPERIERNGVIYRLNWSRPSTHTIQLCIEWPSGKQRGHRVCGEARR